MRPSSSPLGMVKTIGSPPARPSSTYSGSSNVIGGGAGQVALAATVEPVAAPAAAATTASPADTRASGRCDTGALLAVEAALPFVEPSPRECLVLPVRPPRILPVMPPMSLADLRR